MDRPAVAQVNPDSRETTNATHSGTYNIWYGRWTGEGRKRLQLEAARTRCKVERDQGYTKAVPGSPFCIYFARGCCSRGKDCQFWHRVPTPEDHIDHAVDVFGRERFRDEREDMGGIGSFEKCNKTLYVGNIGTGNREVMEILRKNFMEWGEIEHINILPHKSVAFVRYFNRSNAEFAKEAMYGQSLGNTEVLNIRWATEDPNPRVVREKEALAKQTITDAIVKNLTPLGEHGNVLDYASYYQNNYYQNNHIQCSPYVFNSHYDQEQVNKYYADWAASDPEGYARWYNENINQWQHQATNEVGHIDKGNPQNESE